jgi:malonate transporter
VLCGWLAARQHVLPESAIPGLNAFVLYFALPCMLFRFGAGTPVLQVLNPTILAVYLLCAVVMVGFTIAVTLGPR